MTHPKTCNDCLHKTWVNGSDGCTCICHMKIASGDPPLPAASPEWIEFRASMSDINPEPSSEEKLAYRREY